MSDDRIVYADADGEPARLTFGRSSSWSVTASYEKSPFATRAACRVNGLLGKFGPWRYGRTGDGRRAFFKIY
jgi:hypothetical protein